MENDKVIDMEKKCHCHDRGHRPAIEYREFTKARTGKVHLWHHEIVFVVRGGMSVSRQGDGVAYGIGEGEFIFLPAGTTLRGKAAGDSAILITRMTMEYPECQLFSVEKVAAPLEDKPEGIYPLRTNGMLRHAVGGIIMALRDGMRCRHYMQMEVGRILYLLHAYYTPGECVRFFSSVLSPDIEFSEFVRLKWTEHMTVKVMAHAMNMSEQQFSYRFRRVFGTNPRQWLQQQKTQSIYKEICRNGKKLKDIAAEHGLTTTSLVRYCHRQMGLSPGEIRKALKVDCGDAAAGGRRKKN